MAELEQIALSEELLGVMRNAARKAQELREPFITPRALLLALLDDPGIGPAIAGVVNREKVLSADLDENFGTVRAIEEFFPEGEQPAITRYDTLAFKTPDSRASMWLTREALRIFVEGALRTGEQYYPKQLALGFAAEAVHSPGVLAAIRVEPGFLADAIYKL